jgi:hypothetical protein
MLPADAKEERKRGPALAETSCFPTHHSHCELGLYSGLTQGTASQAGFPSMIHVLLHRKSPQAVIEPPPNHSLAHLLSKFDFLVDVARLAILPPLTDVA